MDSQEPPPSYVGVITTDYFVRNISFLNDPANKVRFNSVWKAVLRVYKAQQSLRQTFQPVETITFMNFMLELAAKYATILTFCNYSDESIIEIVSNWVFYVAWVNNASWVPTPKAVSNYQKFVEDDSKDAEELFRAISSEVAM